MRHEKCLSSKKVRMGAGEDLGRRPIELVYGGVLGRKA